MRFYGSWFVFEGVKQGSNFFPREKGACIREERREIHVLPFYTVIWLSSALENERSKGKKGKEKEKEKERIWELHARVKQLIYGKVKLLAEIGAKRSLLQSTTILHSRMASRVRHFGQCFSEGSAKGCWNSRHRSKAQWKAFSIYPLQQSSVEGDRLQSTIIRGNEIFGKFRNLGLFL